MGNEVIECTSQRGFPLFSDGNGYWYRVRIRKPRLWRLSCYTSNCRGNGILYLTDGEEGRRIKHLSIHTCTPNTSLPEALSLRRNILKRCGTEKRGTLRRIFHEELTKSDVPPEVASQISYNTIESSMYRARKSIGSGSSKATTSQSKTPSSRDDVNQGIESSEDEDCSKSRVQRIDEKFPPIPVNMKDFIRSLTEYEDTFLDVYGENFLSGVVGEGEEVAVVFIIKQLIEVMTADGAELHMDANYKHLPEEPEIEQMLTIMVTHQDYAFPVVVAMMTKKSANLYYLILNHVKETIPDLAPQTIVSNHDSDLLTAIAEVFPQKNGTKNVVCWFHYTQSIYKKVLYLGLAMLSGSDVYVKKTTQMIVALALLPPALVEEGMDCIESYFQDNLDNQGISDRDLQKIDSLFSYVRDYWLGEIGSNSMSVYGQRSRTNNFIHSYHKRLKAYLGGVEHPNIWSFQKCLVGMAREAYTDVLRLENHPVLRKRRKAKWDVQDRIIKNLTNQLMANPPQLNTFEFLSALANRCKTREVVGEESIQVLLVDFEDFEADQNVVEIPFEGSL